MAGEKTTDTALQDTVNKLWDSDTVHVMQTGYTKLLEAWKTVACDLPESNRGRMKNPRINRAVKWQEWLPPRTTGGSQFNRGVVDG
jgi:hypothetical protein